MPHYPTTACVTQKAHAAAGQLTAWLVNTMLLYPDWLHQTVDCSKPVFKDSAEEKEQYANIIPIWHEQ